MTFSKTLATVAILAMASPALAGGACSGYGHASSASVAAAEPAQSTLPEAVTLIATLDCADLTGEQYETCIAAQAE